MLKKMSFLGLALLALVGVLLVANPAAAQVTDEVAGVEARGERDGERPDRPRRFGAGEILSIDGDTLTVEPRQGNVVTVLTDENTIVHILDNPEATLADLAVGDVIGGRWQPTENENEILARRIVVRPEGVRGQIESINGSEIVLTKRDGETVTVFTSDETVFRVGKNNEATIADFTAGDRIIAAGEVSEDGSSVTATHVGKRGQRPAIEGAQEG